jgi:hypothetical protein
MAFLDHLACTFFDKRVHNCNLFYTRVVVGFALSCPNDRVVKGTFTRNLGSRDRGEENNRCVTI